MKHIAITILLMLFPYCLVSQVNDVTLIVSGEGANKEQSILAALRNAIEQTYGTFVSANTTILNDELICDDVATISSGNIKDYKIISETYDKARNLMIVSLRATLSINNLVSYAKNKGASVELSGQNFLMETKMRELYRNNEFEALLNLKDQVEIMLEDAFDYNIGTSNPKKLDDGNYKITVFVRAHQNSNGKAIEELILNTLRSLSLSKEEYERWESAGFKPTKIVFNDHSKDRESFYLRGSRAFVCIPFYEMLLSYYERKFSWGIKVTTTNGYINYYPFITYKVQNRSYNNTHYLINNTLARWSDASTTRMKYSPSINHNRYDDITRYTDYIEYDYYDKYVSFSYMPSIWFDEEKNWDDDVLLELLFYFTEDEIGSLTAISIRPLNNAFITDRHKLLCAYEIIPSLPSLGNDVYINQQQEECVIRPDNLEHPDDEEDVRLHIRTHESRGRGYGYNYTCGKAINSYKIVGINNNWKKIDNDFCLSFDCLDKDDKQVEIKYILLNEKLHVVFDDGINKTDYKYYY